MSESSWNLDDLIVNKDEWEVGVDNDGQIIIYTGLRESYGMLVRFIEGE